MILRWNPLDQFHTMLNLSVKGLRRIMKRRNSRELGLTSVRQEVDDSIKYEWMILLRQFWTGCSSDIVELTEKQWESAGEIIEKLQSIRITSKEGNQKRIISGLVKPVLFFTSPPALDDKWVGGFPHNFEPKVRSLDL